MLVGTQRHTSIHTNEQLFRFYLETNDEKYLSEILKLNVWMIIKIVQKVLRSVPISHQDDLMQEGYIGFFEGLKRYDISLGVKINTHCTFWVRKYVLLYLEVHKNTVRIPQWVLRKGVTQSVVDFNEEEFEYTDEDYEDRESELWIDYIISNLSSGREDAIRLVTEKVKVAESNDFKKFLVSIVKKIEEFKVLETDGYFIITKRWMEFWQKGSIGHDIFSILCKDVFLYEQKRYNFTVSQLKSGDFKIKI